MKSKVEYHQGRNEARRRRKFKIYTFLCFDPSNKLNRILKFPFAYFIYKFLCEAKCQFKNEATTQLNDYGTLGHSLNASGDFRIQLQDHGERSSLSFHCFFSRVEGRPTLRKLTDTTRPSQILLPVLFAQFFANFQSIITKLLGINKFEDKTCLDHIIHHHDQINCLRAIRKVLDGADI